MFKAYTRTQPDEKRFVPAIFVFTRDYSVMVGVWVLTRIPANSALVQFDNMILSVTCCGRMVSALCCGQSSPCLVTIPAFQKRTSQLAMSCFHRILLLTLLLVIVHAPQTLADEQTEFFQTHVEPILRENCFPCHSHASGALEGGLTLDWRSGWQAGGSRGPAVVPGNPEDSLLIRAVRHLDDDFRMPEQKLADSEIDVLVRWVQLGAYDPRTVVPEANSIDADWWSLRPLVRPDVPLLSQLPSQNSASHSPDVLVNPIDQFVDFRLQKEGLQPGTEADRRTLIRRLTVDLHGVLPDAEATAAFIADPDPEAFEKLVDRLLDSPRYGERWARHWMDTIHFADSHGFEHDVFRPNAWRFRDYLIRSFNQDISWPRFIREQLAADAFFPGSPELIVALGYLGAGTYDHSAASTAPENFENLDRDDMVTQTMAAFVSTTANCARCHDHKFDPVTQADYYSLQAVFAGIGKGEIPLDDDPNVAAMRRKWQQLKSAADQSDFAVLKTPENQELVQQLEQQVRSSAAWSPVRLLSAISIDAAQLQQLDDGSVLSTGPLPEKETTSLTFSSALPQITAIRLDVLPHESLPAGGPGRAENGNLHLNEVELRVFRNGNAAGERLTIRRATSDFDQDGWTIQQAIDGDLNSGWGIHPQEGKAHSAVFELESPLVIEPGLSVNLLLRQIHGRGHIIGRMKLSATDSAADQTTIIPQDVQALLEIPEVDRSLEQQQVITAFLLKRRAEEELRRLPPPQKIYAAGTVAENERGTIRYESPREIRILRRGNVEQKGDVAGPGALSIFEFLPARFDQTIGQPESARRAALADWIAAPENPLTWRSIANRVWHYHFGRGLSDTPGDFGRMGSLPSHPELLDWLACEIRHHGSLKRLHRLICTSAAYRRTSFPAADALRIDPENRLLSHMSRQRLDADTWRDSVLLAAGRLDLSMGGPGIAHFSSRPGAQLTPILDYSNFDWDSPGATRRSIYRVVWRGIADPLLEPLDFPDLGLLSPVRGFSVSPLQALTLMNNRFVLHHCRHMAQRALQVGNTPEEQVRAAVRWTWQREPSDFELQRLTRLARDNGMDSVCRLLLNTNEFLFVD